MALATSVEIDAVTPVRAARGKAETGTLDLALRILEFLAQQPQPVALTAIARNFAASKATVYRHLQGLMRQGFVRRDPNSRYAVGIKLMVLGEQCRSQFEIVGVARDELLQLRDRTGQAISICALIDDDLVVLDLVHGRTLVEFTTRPGTRLDLHASAHGKIWLAFGPDDLLQRVLARPRREWTPHTITDPKALATEVAAARKRGWATAPNQVAMGVNTLAAPVRDHRGLLVGSIAIIGSTQVLPVKPAEPQINDVLAAARRISGALGFKEA